MIIKEAMKFSGFMEELFTASGKDAEMLAKKYPNMHKNATELGKRGWVLFLLPKPIKEQMESLSADEFDRQMTAVYTASSLNEDAKSVLASSISDYRKAVFFQAFKACGNGLYYPCYAAIISQIEGLLTDIGKDYLKNIWWREKVEKMFKEMDDVDYFDLLLYQSLKSFVYEFTNPDFEFDKKEPDNLNRHWVLHGRTTVEITRLDCIKLIRAFYVFSYFYSLIKGEPGKLYNPHTKE